MEQADKMSYKNEVIKKMALEDYHNLENINSSNNPNESMRVKKELIEAIRNSDLNIMDGLNVIKNTLLHLEHIAIYDYLEDCENQERNKFEEDLK